MKKEILIKQDLDRGMSLRIIAEKHGVGVKIVRNIKDNGRYYWNINTNSIVFTSKKTSVDEQKFNYLYSCIHTKNKNLDVSLNPRLADFLRVDPRQTNRWSKKECRLIGCDEKGIIDNCFEQYLSDFYDYLDKYQPKKRTCKIKAPHTQGLYFLYQNDELKYIGRTKDIKRRLYQHSYFSHVDGLIGTYDVKVIEVENEVDLEIMEVIFIKLLKPPLNTEFYDNRITGKVFTHMLSLIPNEYACDITIKKIKIEGG